MKIERMKEMKIELKNKDEKTVFEIYVAVYNDGAIDVLGKVDIEIYSKMLISMEQKKRDMFIKYAKYIDKQICDMPIIIHSLVTNSGFRISNEELYEMTKDKVLPKVKEIENNLNLQMTIEH